MIDVRGASLNDVILDWIDATEEGVKYFEERHMENTPPEMIAEVSGSWLHHNGPIREQDDLVNIDCYNISDTGYMRYVAKSLKQQETYFCRQQCTASAETEYHRHEYVEIGYVVKGILRQNILGQEEIFHEGEICVIGQNSVHNDYLSYGDNTILFLGMSNDLFERADMFGQPYNKAQDFFRKIVIQRKKDLKFLRFTPRAGAREELETILALIIQENSNMRVGYMHIVSGLLERLNDILFSQYQISMSKKEQSKVRKLLFDDVASYIDANYDTVSLDELCHRFSYNTYYFNRLIKENTGMTYSEYLCMIRLDKAAYFLKTTRDPIESIALRVGYTNQGFFYQKFQERFRVSPKAYREGRA